MRTVRKWLTARVTDVAVGCAPLLPRRTPDDLGGVLAWCGRRLPVLARQVADNMAAAGVGEPGALRAYFDQVGGHFAGALHALRLTRRAKADGGAVGIGGAETTGADTRLDTPASGTARATRPPAAGEFLALARERVLLDASVERLATAARAGGVVLVGPHITGYLLSLARLNATVPLTIYLRYTRDAGRLAAKARWYAASGVDWISEPADAGDTLGRLGRMTAAVREGRTLFITPDLPQRRADGTAVRLFDREVYLPAGFATLAVRARAPLFLLTASLRDGRQCLHVDGPFAPPATGGGDSRRALIAQQMQWFADGFTDFARREPALWYLWGDKRWTRVFRGDARYVGALDGSDEPRAGAPQRDPTAGRQHGAASSHTPGAA